MLNAQWVHHYAVINGIHTHYVEQGEGIPVVLCHGFPHLWFSWHRQIPVLAEAGFRVIAPDMRGMGQTEAPDDPREYDVDHITGDLLGLLDHIGEEKAIFIGLDFGAFANYDFALRHPERTIAVIGLENPAAPHDPNEPPLTGYRRMGAEHFLHINYFLEPPRADIELAEQTRRFLHTVFWTLSGEVSYFDMFKFPPETSYIDAMVVPPPLPWPWLSELELEFFVSEYSQCGFTGGINWYRSMDMKWEQRRPYEGVQSEVPAWFIGSENDVDLEGFHGDDPIAQMRAIFPKLMDVQMIPGAGHMIQLEATEALNVILLDYLARIRNHGI
ncbi:alpha/beta hydrolase [Halieaceae bacterium IMCC14734]|uniref:Alpha/beta hydrolase n=1 Tax=Candidatus Litorirhabdus singularis TaxID=2518993 RepID=A0ABT3TIP5_9GAMM|nr:alpha/beta hydrolase [Candidatus Litorirhabdus singularis]MCX2982183.1 alpha/beta hydrolase [Candidatus Litorirhabdus singularis]